MRNRTVRLAAGLAVAFLGGDSLLAATATTTGNFAGGQFDYLFNSQDGSPGGLFFDRDSVPVVGLQQFNPAAGSLTAIEFSATANFDVDAAMDTNVIIETNLPHSAGFDPPSMQINVAYSPSSAPTTGHFFAIETFNIDLQCQGVPADGDGCMGFGGGSSAGLPTRGDVFEDIDLADFLGTGTVDRVTIDTFVPGRDGGYFTLNNVGGANSAVLVDIGPGEVDITYTFNTGESAEEPLLPLPPGLEPPEFIDAGIGCDTAFCLILALGGNGIGVTQHAWFDPPAAVGFNYQVVAGPNIASVELPSGFGDDQYEVLAYDQSALMFVSLGTVAAGETLDLTSTFPAGVSRLRVLGIEKSAGVDSEDPQGFPTGLTFVSGNEQVSMAMTAIIPEPTAALLAVAAAAILSLAMRRAPTRV